MFSSVMKTINSINGQRHAHASSIRRSHPRRLGNPGVPMLQKPDQAKQQLTDDLIALS
ncbi:MAG: hypothetical protein AAFR31_00795 [Cyanobacteria bacterium J06627_8]